MIEGNGSSGDVGGDGSGHRGEEPVALLEEMVLEQALQPV